MAKPQWMFLSFLTISCTVWHCQGTDQHGGVPMGISENDCDDAVSNIELDWDPNSTEEYTCTEGERTTDQASYEYQCENKAKEPVHICYPEEITYNDALPVSGSHRPLWPKYGEYTYLPPQRWLHSLEHGAIVFLYHPCADDSAIEEFKDVARSCLRRHIISPSKALPSGANFALLAWKCKLTLGHPTKVVVENFIKKHALMAPETITSADGQYGVGLLQKAELVSDIFDSKLCPS